MGISQSIISRRKGITFPSSDESTKRRRGRRRRRRGGEAIGLDNNSWLLAEAEAEQSEAEPHSVNSSFRFSFGSQPDAELDAAPSAAATVLLLVSMEEEKKTVSEKQDHEPAALSAGNWRRLEFLEQSIAPVAGGLVRFSYAQIRSATRDFYREKRRKVLPWAVRFKVAVGVARAVEYLHFCTDKCVVHRDIKPSNILLSSKKRPMLCDFGLATWTHGPSLPFLCKAVKGTFGYLAPEYFQNGKLSDKTDVYAFGVVLLELITGRKALDQDRPQGDENLVVWAKPLLRQGEDAIEKLVDPRLTPGSYRTKEMRRMVRAANACLSCDDSARPSIDLVLEMLLGEEGNGCSSEMSLFSNNGCLAGYGSQFHETVEKRDMGGHLALAMLGISDNEEDDCYGR